MRTENSALNGAQRGVRLLPTSSTDRRNDALSKTSERGRDCFGRLPSGECRLNQLQRVATAQGGSDDPDFKYQKEHEQEWKQKLGRDRVLQIVESVPANTGLPDFLNRLEEGGHRYELVWHISLRHCLPQEIKSNDSCLTDAVT